MGIDSLFLDQEQRQAHRSARAGLALALGFFIVLGFSCSELRYSLRGRVTEGTITAIAPAPAVGRRAVVVRFHYTDDQQKGQAGKHVYKSGRFQPPPDGKMKVIYVPGDPASAKPVSARRWWAVILLLTLAAAGVAWVAVTARRLR